MNGRCVKAYAEEIGKRPDEIQREICAANFSTRCRMMNSAKLSRARRLAEREGFEPSVEV